MMLKKLSMIVAVFWLVRWTSTATRPTTCECAKPARSPYTDEYDFPSGVCAAYCSEQVVKQHERRFDAKENAEEFIKGCPKSTCNGWELEEVHE